MKIDLKKGDLYRPPATEWVEVDVPPVAYLAIDGAGDPNVEPRYAAAVESLFTVGYTLKFATKARGLDFVVGPLEGLWEADDPSSFVERRKGEWRWTMMIPLPDGVSVAEVDEALAAAAGKKPGLPIRDVERRVVYEGRSLQIMHIGPYDDEDPCSLDCTTR